MITDIDVFNDLLRLEEAIYENRCPDAKKGCIVVHDMQSVIDKIQECIDEREKISRLWPDPKIVFNQQPRDSNDTWIANKLTSDEKVNNEL